MHRKERFPPEADTQPDILRAKALAARQSGVAPKNGAHEVETPAAGPTSKTAGLKSQRAATARRGGDDSRSAAPRARRKLRPGVPSAAVEEVVADLSQDPRREQDEDE
jgi:hypothetical protein